MAWGILDQIQFRSYIGQHLDFIVAVFGLATCNSVILHLDDSSLVGQAAGGLGEEERAVGQFIWASYLCPSPHLQRDIMKLQFKAKVDSKRP